MLAPQPSHGRSGMETRSTNETGDRFQRAYDVLNQVLFQGTLANCLVTLRRRTGTCGYISGARFGRADGHVAAPGCCN